MKVTIDQVENILGYFAIIFPLPETAGGTENFVKVWFDALKKHDGDDVLAAAEVLFNTLRQFPFPVDFHEEIAAAKARRSEQATG